MKAKFVLLVLLLPIFSTMSVSAQIPTANISITCDDSMIEVDYLYDTSFEFNPQNSSLICTLSNPTQYQETVELNYSTTSTDIQANYPVVVNIGGGQDFDFEVTFTIDENITNSNSMNALMSINATVTAIQSAPPPNTAKDEVNNIGFSVLNLFESTSLYLHSDENKSIWSSFQMPNYSHHPHNMSEEKDNGVITIDQKYNVNQVIDRKLTMDVGSEINANFSVYYEGDMDSTDNAGPCTPDNTPTDCDWLNITIYNENYILHKHTETPWPAGNWKNIQLSWVVGENNATLNGTEDMNLTVHISMKIKGDYQEDIFFASGEPAKFDISNASENDTGYVNFPFTDVYDVNSSTNGSLDSNSTQLSITEIGPFRNSVDSYISPNGTEYPVLFLKESFHIVATLSQMGGSGLENKCLNIYIDPDENPIPITTIQTDENGVIEWFSGDPLQNPSLKGIETTNGKLEGLRTLRVSYEPEQNVTGGCDEDLDSQTSGSYSEVEILVQSRVDIQVVNSWSYFGENAQYEDSQITGEVILLRDRLDLVVENEEIIFSRQYISPNSADWITDYENISTTDELGKAEFNWTFDGKTCSNEPCSGVWRVVAYYPGSFLFAPSQNNISFEIHTKDSVDSDGDGVSDHLDEFPDDANETHDDDGDGVGNNTDAFPQDANETMDTDGDGVGDNADVEPDNPDVRYSDDIKVEISDRSSYIIAGAIVFLALVILFVRRKQPPINDTHSQFAYEESLFKDN